MKRVLLAVCFVLCASVSYAGQLFFYGEADLAPKWKATAGGTSQYSQGVAPGIGIEFMDTISDDFSYAVGGKYQIDRNISYSGQDPLYHLHTIYGQILFNLNSQGLAAGFEVNYSIHGGDSYYESGASLDGDFGQAFVLSYQRDTYFIKTGYRIINATATIYGIEVDIESSGLFLQFGHSF